MNLNAAGVMELNAEEMREVDGGWIKEVVAAVVDVIENWDKYKTAFLEGFAVGQKV